VRSRSRMMTGHAPSFDDLAKLGDRVTKMAMHPVSHTFPFQTAESGTKMCISDWSWLVKNAKTTSDANYFPVITPLADTSMLSTANLRLPFLPFTA
jgi:hypothetical protein